MNTHSSLLLVICLFVFTTISAQPVTGYWKGKIDGKKVEVKIIKNGDSLTGTSYYYESPNSFRRYSIKGYFDSRDNSVVWWDDQLIEQKKGSRLLGAASSPAYISIADFNCPGGTKMFLLGNASKKENEKPAGTFELQKYDTPVFTDEWNDVIDNYTVGANDPNIIDSVEQIAFIKPIPEIKKEIPAEEIKETITPEVAVTATPKPIEKPIPATTIEIKPVIDTPTVTPIIPAPGIDEKFTARKKVILTEIPLAGDSVELNFYDNAEVDGDSIAIFINGHLMQEHIRLTEKAYVVKLAIAELEEITDLVMVAENLGSIPPNTSYMVCYINGKRYEARLESTEQSSAAIRFFKPNKKE